MTEPTPAKKVVVRTPLTPTENKQRKQVRVRVRETENLLCIGSENWYNSFWWKMMFIGAAFVGARSMRRADRQTLAYVDRGYTRYEKLAIENLAAERGFTTTAIGSSSALLGLLNRDRGNTALLDVMFFSHGTPGYISLNFYGTPSVDLSSANLRSVVPTAFAPNGRIFSYACRTGVAVDDEEFEREADAEPESSLAQRLADHFQIEVHAHLRRTLYRSVLRAPGTSDALVASLNAARPAQDGRVIQLPPDHEALPHPDLGRSYNPFRQGPRNEGTADYALWRKQGGLALPVSDSTPSGVGAGLRVFRPQS